MKRFILVLHVLINLAVVIFSVYLALEKLYLAAGICFFVLIVFIVLTWGKSVIIKVKKGRIK